VSVELPVLASVTPAPPSASSASWSGGGIQDEPVGLTMPATPTTIITGVGLSFGGGAFHNTRQNGMVNVH